MIRKFRGEEKRKREIEIFEGRQEYALVRSLMRKERKGGTWSLEEKKEEDRDWEF